MSIRIAILPVMLAGVLLAACSSGPQTLRLADGAEFNGRLHKGLLHSGELEWPNGDHYQGEFAEGMMHGKGMLTLSSGDVYSGYFVEGQLEGLGHYVGVDGTRYRGSFAAGEFHGLGEMVDAEGNLTLGIFRDGLLTGLGVYHGASAESYIGAFAAGRFAGFGRYTSDKGVYTGEFARGFFHGEGEYVHRPDDAIEQGQWRWGRFEGSGEDKAERLTEAQAAEQALYAQHERLARQRDSLAVGDSGTIELYLLTAALDGKQKVFAREIETVNTIMDQRFAVAPRTLSLSNHPQTFAELPLATLTGVDQALQSLADKMNAEQDILFIYLTSHGSEDHQLSVQLPGVGLHDLPAEHVGKLIKDSPIKWKVILVSSCYSGGFIPHLQSPTHLLITAARSDRTSFGCSDDADMTYFGRAFFSEALPGAENFQAAFEYAKQRVTEWEDEDDYPHSEPQMVVGEEIDAYLREWFLAREE